MKTQKPRQPRTNSPNSRWLTAAGATRIAALLLSVPASAFAQSQNAEQPAGEQQPAGGFSQPADGAGPGAFNQAAPSGQLQGPVRQQQQSPQGPVRQQQQSTPLPKVPDKLDDMLTLALRSNPEILLAESKLRQAQSELNQSRLKVTEEVVSLYYERKKQEELLGQLNQQLKAVQSAFRAGQTPSDKVIEAMIARSTAAAAVPQIEAQTRYLLGLGGEAAGPQPQGAARSETVTTLPRPEMPEKFRKILEMPANFEFEDTPLEVVLEYFSTEYETPFLIDNAASGEVGRESPISFSANALTLPQALQAMLDVGFSDARGYTLCFVFRDYGILVSTPERARKLYGATIPPELPMDASAVPPAQRQ